MAELVAKDGGIGIVVDRGDRAPDVAHLDSTLKTARGTTRDHDLRGSQGSLGPLLCRIRNANTEVMTTTVCPFELAKGRSSAGDGHRRPNKRVSTASESEEAQEHQEGLCLHHHGALNEVFSGS